MRYYGKIHSKLPIFRVKSVKIYTGQFFFTQTPSVVSVTNKRYGKLVSLTKGKWETPAPGVRHNVGPVGGAGGSVEAQGRGASHRRCSAVVSHGCQQ